ncbi:multidrug transporter [Arenibacter certesii]|uniref:Multidrug transporter n=2 Tax=Arenibacter certesii TaxID=228955 RepID=A0A918IPB3_9FLAO|nr:multidrug transporter [Arenibacter certesii]
MAAFGAATIYGINHTIAKGAMPHYVPPYGFIFLRLFGAALLFWGISFFGPKENLKKEDWGRILVCAVFGMGINMLTFFKGLSLSTPINSAILITITPILVVLLSALILKEKISLQRGAGVFIGLIGALGLILFGAEIRSDAGNIPLGNALFIINATTYGLYLILVKKLLEKYHPFTLMKWLFSIGFLITLPITYPEYSLIEWQELPLAILGAIAFVIIGTTFLTYLFNVYALTQLKASTVGVFMYLQPLIGIIYAIAMRKDHLTIVKVVAIIFVLMGVYLASRKTTPSL